MQATALQASPRPHSQPFKPFRTTDCAAIGTGLRTHTLVRLNEPCPRPHGQLVLEHRAERGPASIQDGFRHLGAGERRAVHVTHNDKGVFLGDAGGKGMQEVAALRRDLAVYFSSQSLAPGALRLGKTIRRLPNVARIADRFPGRESGKVLQSEIDTDLAAIHRRNAANLTDQIEKPAAGGILAETAAADVGGDRPRKPQAIVFSEKPDGITINLQGPVALERNPAQRPLLPEADAPFWTSLSLVSTDSELLANSLYGIAVEAKLLGGTVGQFDQVKAAGPASVEPLAVVLNAAAVIPYLIAGNRHFKQPLGCGCALDPIAKCQKDIPLAQDPRTSRCWSTMRRIRSETVMPSRTASALRKANCGSVNVTDWRTLVLMGQLYAPHFHASQWRALLAATIPPRPKGRGFSRRSR